MKTRICFLLPLLLAGITANAAQRVVVEAGDQNYRNAITTLAVPESFPEQGELRGQGIAIPFQKGADGTIVFVVPELKAGEKRTLQVSGGKGKEGIAARLENGRIEVGAAGKEIFTYQGEESELPRSNIAPEFKRGGYIHPVYTPGGKLVTDDYPPNHIHHHGIWFPWTKTSFEGRDPDFWNMGQKKGKVEFVEFGRKWSGPVHAGFTSKHRFIDLTAPEPKTALNEEWEVVAYRLPSGGREYFVFDLVSKQRCATDAPLKLPKYHYGGLGFRGNWSWNGKDECHFLTSSGETDRVKGNETRGNWCHIGGEVEGAFAGIAILCHPENFRAPQPMRLHPTEPFFCFAPSQLGDWEIAPGQTYVSRYRFIVADGKPDAAEIDRQWQQYAKPPKARIE